MTKKRRGLHDPARADEPSLFNFADELPAPAPPASSARSDQAAQAAPDAAPVPKTSTPAAKSPAATAKPAAPSDATPAVATSPAAGSSAKRSALPWKSTPDKPYTVSQLNAFTKQTLEDTFNGIWVEGEIAELKLSPQNHLFFKLKDTAAQLDARMWNSYLSRLKFKPEPGMKVLVNGRVEFYEKRGMVSLNAWRIEPTGAGALQAAFEQLKKKLAAEGLFDQVKRPLPEFPATIGLVTSPTAAALHDILTTLRKRWPVARVIISPAQVQGDTAPPTLVKALTRLYRSKLCDVIIVGRGGGSLEDLAAFNAEIVVRCVAKSPVPIVSAVGHEVDFTLCDFAADHRAPTPTAAAQLVAPDRRQLREYVRQRREDLRSLFARRVLDEAERWRDLTRHLRRARPAGRVLAQAQAWTDLDTTLRDAIQTHLQAAAADWQRLDARVSPQSLRLHLSTAADRVAQLTAVLPRDIRGLFERQATRTAALSQQLTALSPLNVLARGYTVTQAVDLDGRPGAVLKTVAQARRAKRLRTRLTDGTVDSDVRE
ncbi:MAG TPA: exodeoxyribonuclease VII large subunit [Planctomycetota bacterium]|nr:exodeoxyribonuclease VII large subunit [Planctomycetota bacterium]